MSEQVKKQALGRGLAALFETEKKDQHTQKESKDFLFLAPSAISLNPYQPRKVFNREKMQELETSIKVHGILQPLLVRKMGDGYELVAGERRLRTALQLNLEAVPCRILEIENQSSLEIALLENIQRADLNSLEEAKGYLRLIEDFSYTQEVLAEKIGKSRSHIANTLRLLSLPQDVKELLAEGKLTVGHAKCLIGLEDASKFAWTVVEKELSVRGLEKLIKQGKVGALDGEKENNVLSMLGEDHSLASQLTALTGLKVEVLWKKNKGKIQFFMEKTEEVDAFLMQLTRGKI